MTYHVTKKLAFCAALAVVGWAAQVARAAEFDAAMEPILAQYLKIQTALAADSTEGVADAVRRIEDLAAKLDPKKAPEEHLQHYEKIPQSLTSACRKLAVARDIGSIREAFHDLSKPVAMWVTMARPVGKRVMYCPMKKAGWVQEGSEVANPYYGARMLRCGYEVGRGD
jgi:Cu(I)/Ag(I) efflux system membrane fusion protein